VLVVLVIFAIAAGLLTLHLLPDDLDRARHEAEATALLLERAADEAERTGRALAWHPDGADSRFEAPDADGKWLALADDPDFGSRALPGELRWGALQFPMPPDAGGVVAQAAQAAGARDPAAGGTRVVFLPGQLVPVFDIRLGAGTAQVLLHGDALGHVRVETAP